MNEFGLDETPIIMAGGVWWLEEWEHWLDNKEIGPIAFQFGTRPLLTKESPIPKPGSRKLLTLKEGDVYLNRFSPTGFYSSAVDNDFLHELKGRSERQVAYTTEPVGEHIAEYGVGPRKRIVYLTHAGPGARDRLGKRGLHRGVAHPGLDADFRHAGKGPRNPGGPGDCMGCLSTCRFSNWSQHDRITPPARRPIRAVSASRRRCRISRTPATTRRRWNTT